MFNGFRPFQWPILREHVCRIDPVGNRPRRSNTWGPSSRWFSGIFCCGPRYGISPPPHDRQLTSAVDHSDVPSFEPPTLVNPVNIRGDLTFISPSRIMFRRSMHIRNVIDLCQSIRQQNIFE